LFILKKGKIVPEKKKYTIRDVRYSDLPILAAIERQRWTREKTPILSLKTLEEWYGYKSPFFLVADSGNSIDGFYYGMQVSFSLEHIEAFTSTDARTNQGYTTHVHNPSGNSVYGVTIATTAPEAGVSLNVEVHRRLHEMRAAYFIGFSRLVHLNKYFQSIEAYHDGKMPYPEQEIAFWYAYQTMKLLGARVWEEHALVPELHLPLPRRPDTVLKFHVQNTRIGLLRVVSDYMHDPKSRNYGAFIASDWPHVA
jgi:hypothetical protein